MGRTERPVFTCRQAMQEHMRRLGVHCRALWARRLARPGRGRQEAFLSNYLPRPLGGQASLRPFQRVRPQRPHCPPAQPPPPARPAGAPGALGRGLGTVRVLCPAHGAATCAACAATGQGIKYCCSLGHEGHRQRSAQGPGRCVRGSKRPSKCTGLRPPQARCWAPEGGSRRGAHQRMSRRRRGSACCRRQCWGGGVGRRESAPPPPPTSHRAGGPLLGPGHLPLTLPGTPAPTTHGDMGGEGRAAGGWVSLSHSPSHGRTASVALASCLLGGGGCGHPRWLRRRPRLHCPPPLHLWARPAVGAGGREGGARASRTFLAPSRPRSLMRRGRMGHRVTHLHPTSSRGLQGGFGMGRVEVPPHPSATRGSRVLQGRVWGSRALQLSLWCRHRGSQRLLPRVRGVRGLQGGLGMGRAEVPPHPSAIRGGRVLRGRV